VTVDWSIAAWTGDAAISVVTPLAARCPASTESQRSMSTTTPSPRAQMWREMKPGWLCSHGLMSALAAMKASSVRPWVSRKVVISTAEGMGMAFVEGWDGRNSKSDDVAARDLDRLCIDPAAVA
jgi:hypothetical protein